MTTIDEIKAAIAAAPNPPTTGNRELNVKRWVHDLFGDDRLTHLAEQWLGPVPHGSFQRWLNVFAVDGIPFGWIEDGNPKWDYEFAGWVWEIEREAVVVWTAKDLPT